MWQNAHDTYLESRILSADPIELVRMLYQEGTRAVEAARRHLANGDIAARARSITQASSVVIELATSLDHERGGKISANLAQLYDYMLRRLAEANLQQSDGPLAEVGRLLGTLSEGWDGVKAQGVAAPAPRHETSLPEPAAAKPAVSYGGSWEQPGSQEGPATYGSSWAQPRAKESAVTYGNSWAQPSTSEPEVSYAGTWGQAASGEPAATFGDAWRADQQAESGYGRAWGQASSEEPATLGASPTPANQDIAAAYGSSWAQPSSQEPAAGYGNAWTHLAQPEPAASYSPHDWSL